MGEGGGRVLGAIDGKLREAICHVLNFFISYRKIESNDEEGHQELQQFVKKVSSRDLLVNKILPLRSQGTSRDIE